MWIIVLITLVGLIIGKFVYDNIRQNSAMKKAGGMAVKYAELVDACLACDGAGILKEKLTFISIGGKVVKHGITVYYAFWIQHTFNNTINVKYVLKGVNMPQRIVQQWNFSQHIPQEEMIKAMKKHLDELMSNDLVTYTVSIKNIRDIAPNTSNNLKSLSTANLQQTQRQLRLAPGVSVDDMAYGIMLRAKSMASKLSNGCYTPLSTDGLLEAVIYCSVLLIDLREDYTNSLDISKLEDKYFLLLSDELIMLSTKEIDNTVSFLNNRITFYKTVVNRLTNLDEAILRKVYYFFFINPLCEADTNLSNIGDIGVQISTLRLSLIVAALNQQTEDYTNELSNNISHK